jgi:ribosome-binding protein aMBF1 (putative translation factor)
MSTNTVGGKIAEARARVTPYLSQQELAKRLKDAGIDIGTAGVAEIESGNRSLNYYEVSALASILNTTANQLIT